jgi:hypothetical protein
MAGFLQYATIVLTLSGVYASGLSPDPHSPPISKRGLLTELVATCNSSCANFAATVRACDVHYNGEVVVYPSCLCKQVNYNNDAKTCVDCIAGSGNQTLIDGAQYLKFVCLDSGLINMTTIYEIEGILDGSHHVPDPFANSTTSIVINMADIVSATSSASAASASVTGTASSTAPNPAGSTVVIDLTGEGVRRFAPFGGVFGLGLLGVSLSAFLV